MLQETLVAMMTEQEGALLRFSPLPDKYAGNEASLDGAIGLYRGVADMIDRCGAADTWRPVITQHQDI